MGSKLGWPKNSHRHRPVREFDLKQPSHHKRLKSGDELTFTRPRLTAEFDPEQTLPTG
jgi:hypothetical protein